MTAPSRAAPPTIPAAAATEAGALMVKLARFPTERGEATAELDMVAPVLSCVRLRVSRTLEADQKSSRRRHRRPCAGDPDWLRRHTSPDWDGWDKPSHDAGSAIPRG